MIRKVTLLAIVASLCLGALPGLATAAAPTFSPGAPGIGDPYFPLDGNGGYDVSHYGLKVSYDPDTDVLVGQATIEARATQNLSAFNLDFVGLTVRSITVDGRAASWTRDEGELTVQPSRGIHRRNKFTVVVRYDGVPQTLEDLFGTSGFIHTDDGALIVGQPDVAATWFPANDHPRDKASFTFEVTVPRDFEVVANGVLKGQKTRGAWTTWTWDATDPMAPYLAGVGIGHFDIRSYRQAGIKYWDAIDSALMADLEPPLTPENGTTFLYSQVGDSAYKRLTRVIDVPVGGADITFRVERDTEEGWDFLFVEARTAGGDDWTTLPDQNGHTNQDPGACPGTFFDNPFLGHYLTEVPPIVGDPEDPDDDIFFPCDPVGTSGEWNAISGGSDGWETWQIDVPNATASTRSVEISITYASDGSVQGRGVVIDDIVVSTGQGSTSFEPDADQLDGWVAPIARPDEGATDNPNTWQPATSLPALPGLGASALVSFDRQPEIIAFEAGMFGKYPFGTSGGIVDDAGIGFALENQTRPIYSPFFFGGPEGNDFVVVHELAHQWFGDYLAVDTWQHIWLNEGFATYAEWLWSEREGFDTAQQIFDSFAEIPADDEFWQLAIGDPGPESLFAFQVYARGAMTLHALRLEIGDADFFKLLRDWVKTQGGGTVTTDEFIQLAERISGEDLDALFDTWLSAGPPFGATLRRPNALSRSGDRLPAAVLSITERLRDRDGNPFTDRIKAVP